MDIDCTGCGSRCCKDPKTPVLLPSEEEKFKELSRIVKTPFREMHLLGKKKDGSCILLDDETGKCKNYDNRPFECRLFPFLLDFSAGAEVKLDVYFCPNIRLFNYFKGDVTEFIKSQNFPKEWIKGYESLEGC